MLTKSTAEKTAPAGKTLQRKGPRGLHNHRFTKTEIHADTSKAGAAAPAVAATAVRAGSKSAMLLTLLRAKRGATIADMMQTTGWQAHSVRGFLAGAARKRHGLTVTSECPKGEKRRYRVR